MRVRSMIGIAMVSISVLAQAGAAPAQDDRLRQIEQRLDVLEKRVAADDGWGDGIDGYWGFAVPPLAIGLFCGLWARNTGRDFWLWAVGGAIFTVFALLFVLINFAGDAQKAKRAAAEKPSKELLDV